VFNTTQQVGGALGLAVLATLAASRSDALAAAGDSRAAALTGGYQLAFTIAAGLVAVALVVAAVALRPEAAIDVDAEAAVVPLADPLGPSVEQGVEGVLG
jgi:hypothetical protein